MSSDSVQLCLSRKTGEMLHRLRANRPLVHCITNEVVQEFTANVLLAAGASPAMVVGEGEAEYFAGIASALSVNVGTPYEARIETMKKAIRWSQLRQASLGCSTRLPQAVFLGVTKSFLSFWKCIRQLSEATLPRFVS